MESLDDLIVRAQAGDLEAFGRLVRATQSMAYAVARGVLRDSSMAEDAAQEAYLRAFRRLRDLEEGAAFAGWLRRIVITVALNMRRSRRVTLLRLDDVPEVPVLDEAETSWSEVQRRRLAGALLTLTSEERQVCDRRYHGHWSTARLARQAGVDEPAMRKRLQRIRDKLRKEMEVSEQHGIRPEEIRPDFPAKIVELLARPQLTDLPENPVGQDPRDPSVRLRGLRRAGSSGDRRLRRSAEDHRRRGPVRGPDRAASRGQGPHPAVRPHVAVAAHGSLRRHSRCGSGRPARRTGSCQIDATHLEAFHQAEALCLDERSRLDPWRMTGQVLQSVDLLFPGRAVKIVPTQYTMCSQAWELEVEDEGRWFEVLAWGVFTDKIVKHLGGDPAVHTAVGVGYGLERLAMLRYGIDDIRKIEVASVA